ncbi:hypothetical protein GCM10027592_38490 [Spirosoma flavus]
MLANPGNGCMGVLKGGLGYFVVGSTSGAAGADVVFSGLEAANPVVAIIEAAKPLPIPPITWRRLS